MSIVLNPAQPVEYRPRDDGPTYFLRIPTVADRIKYSHALRARKARFYGNLLLMDQVRNGLLELLPGDENAEAREAGIALVDAYSANLRETVEARQQVKSEETDRAFTEALKLPDGLVSLMDEVADRYEPLRNALADNAVYWSWAGYEAARMFLAGWEGLGPFKRGLSGPDEASLAQIPPMDLEMLGVKIEQLMQPDEARLKNSVSPSSTPSEPPISADSSATPRKSRSAAEPETASA